MPTLRDMILILGYEGESGLWEAYGETVGIYGHLPRQVIVDLAKSAVESLVRDGLIELHWTQEPLTKTWPLDQTQMSEALSNAELWDAPKKDGISIRLSATEIGRAAFLSPE